MAETVRIDSDVVLPGDMIDLVYQVVGGNETMIALAVHSIKQNIAEDQRFDYQSGHREYRTDLETGKVHEYLIVRVILRRTMKDNRRPIQQASIVGIVAIAGAAVIYYATTLALGHYVHLREVRLAESVVNDPNAGDVVKAAALGMAGSSDGRSSWMPWAVLGGILGVGYLANKRS